MPEGHDTTIEVSNIMSFVLYTQILKHSVLKPASPGIIKRTEFYFTSSLVIRFVFKFLSCAFFPSVGDSILLVVPFRLIQISFEWFAKNSLLFIHLVGTLLSWRRSRMKKTRLGTCDTYMYE